MDQAGKFPPFGLPHLIDDRLFVYDLTGRNGNPDPSGLERGGNPVLTGLHRASIKA